MSNINLDQFSTEGLIPWTGELERGKGKFPDGRAAGTVSGIIVTEALPRDWSGFGSLQFTLHNPWDRTVIGGFELYDEEALGSPELEYGDYIDRRSALLIGEGVSHVVIQIDPIQTTQGTRMLDLERVVKVAIRVPEPNEGEKPMSISALRLSREQDEPDNASAVSPGESIIVIRHLDISCYTYEPEKYEDPADVVALADELIAEIDRLRHVVNHAEINGKQTFYAQAALVTADIALTARPMLAWHFSPRAKRDNYAGALSLVRAHREQLEPLLSSRRHEDDEDDSNLAMSTVKPVPDLSTLQIRGKAFVDPSGQPILICSMSYINEGALMKFFAPEQHKIEIYAVGGGSRYDIEWSPVYEAFHKYPGTKRVGWRGWCGHLIKDQWAMGGRKENVVICLESPHILEAIEAYNRMHADDWRHLPSLMYIILGYELTYMCYCEESQRRFREWLEERHGTIAVLNDKWGTDYRYFKEIVPPATEMHSPLNDTNRAAWFDWADWNTRRFTDHLRWSKASVRKLHPGIPICAGGSHSMLSPQNGTSGIDEEMIINEVDDVILHEGNDLLGIDLFQALADSPKPLVDPEQGGDCKSWLLNYLHGKCAISKFWWPKQPSRQFPRSTLRAPLQGTMPIKDVYEHLSTALDIRRLNKEIAAFWDISKEVAILYSKTNMLQVGPELIAAKTTPYLTALRATYDAARCLEAGITFISEKQMAAGKADRYKLILLPAVKHLPEHVFAALNRYVRDGGRVLVLPESLVSDEYNRPANYLEQWGIRITGTETPSVEGFGEMEQKYDQNLERSVRYGGGQRVEAVTFASGVQPWTFRTAGVYQQVDIAVGNILAAGPAGEPMLVSVPRGEGHIWYVTGTPERESLDALLDLIFAEAGVDRPLKVTDMEGNRVPGLEARLVRRHHDDLVYIANDSGREVEFRMETDRPVHEIRELRSLRYYAETAGCIADGQTLLFSLREDPTIRFSCRSAR